MKASFYIVVNDKGTVRTVKNRPGLDWNEIAISVKLDLPNALFQRPQFEASITVPETAVTPTSIEVGVADNIRDAIEQATGYEVKLTFVTPEIS